MTKKTMFDQNSRRTGYFYNGYGAEEKFAVAVDSHDSAWFAHKQRCLAQELQRLKNKGVTEDAKLLERELKLLEKGINTTAYNNDGHLNPRKLERSQYSLVNHLLVYRALCEYVK